ncbi:MAG: hypothetical protein ACRYFZ_03610 [Janthinobacterium lividum]
MLFRYTCFRLLVLSLGFFLPALAWAQGSPNWNWVQQGPSAVASGGRGIVVAPSGNVFVTGYFTHTLTLGATTLTTDSTDAFVAKYTAGGQVLWAQKFGSSGQGVGCQVVADANDNCYVAGMFRGQAQVAGSLLQSQSDGDEFIVKYSAQGTPLWGQRYSDLAPFFYDYLFKTRYFPLASQNMHLALDAQGNLYTAGWFRNTVTRGTATFTAQGTNTDVLVVKYNAQGQV